jgi:hypothetical protein
MVESKVGHVCVCYVDYFPFESKVGHVCVCCADYLPFLGQEKARWCTEGS